MALCHSQVTLMLSTDINITETTYPCSFNMYLIINNCVTAVKVSKFSGHYLRNRSTSDIGVLGYIGLVQHKEHSPEVFHIPPGTPCIYIYRVSQEEWTKLWESVPYVKLYRYNPKHLYPKLNGYGDNGQRSLKL